MPAHQRLGVDVAVIYLEYSYYGKETDGTWAWAIAPIEDQLEPNLEACSTDGLYVKANDPKRDSQGLLELVRANRQAGCCSTHQLKC